VRELRGDAEDDDSLSSRCDEEENTTVSEKLIEGLEEEDYTPVSEASSSKTHVGESSSGSFIPSSPSSPSPSQVVVTTSEDMKKEKKEKKVVELEGIEMNRWIKMMDRGMSDMKSEERGWRTKVSIYRFV